MYLIYLLVYIFLISAYQNVSSVRTGPVTLVHGCVCNAGREWTNKMYLLIACLGFDNMAR